MSVSLFSVISYVLISTFTPGPSNISSASMAVLHGYKNTLKYQIGLAVAVFIFMFLVGWFSTTLLSLFPALEPIMQYVGAGYILHLAWGILKASYTFTEKEEQPLGFSHGLMLNILNPKLVVYAFTLFSAFLSSITESFTALTIVCLLLAITSFCATTTWSLCGTAIKVYLHNPRWKRIVNIVLCILLVYTAATLIGII